MSKYLYQTYLECMYVCMYVCMYMYFMYVRMYVCMYRRARHIP